MRKNDIPNLNDVYKFSDYDLEKFCNQNANFRNLCKNDDFWKNRTLIRFQEIFKFEELEKYKKAYGYKKWKDYYISLANVIEDFDQEKIVLEQVAKREDFTRLLKYIQNNTDKYIKCFNRNINCDLDLNADLISLNRIFGEIYNLTFIKLMEQNKKQLDKYLEELETMGKSKLPPLKEINENEMEIFTKFLSLPNFHINFYNFNKLFNNFNISSLFWFAKLNMNTDKDQKNILRFVIRINDIYFIEKIIENEVGIINPKILLDALFAELMTNKYIARKIILKILEIAVNKGVDEENIRSYLKHINNPKYVEIIQYSIREYFTDVTEILDEIYEKLETYRYSYSVYQKLLGLLNLEDEDKDEDEDEH